MDNTKRLLKVPEDLRLREKLRKEVRVFFSQIDLRPPVKFNKLEELALSLLEKLKISKEYLDFTIVLLGNESWRKTVEATPINRRLLLLPQCLKNSNACKGVLDSLGLVCAGCKSCIIDDILTEAEHLGYTTLVAEGTTVAIGLVEEGAIDAVLGVSCMPVLQRSFQPVSNAAVPVIGLPLLYDGCENTKIDNDWLLEEIRAFEKKEENQPISISQLKSQINSFFTEEKISEIIPGQIDTEKLAKEFLLIDGQRMRPLLAALSFLAYNGIKQENNKLFLLSIIIECFHKASLIHDDIEDDADYRYHVETVHKKYGVPRAINAGDYLIGKGYQILSGLPVEADIIAQSLKVISESHVRLTLGQGTDILFNTEGYLMSIESTIDVFKQKTGEAIKVALLLGAIVGGADENELEILEQFSELVGISYQIRDDLNEFNENNQDEKTKDFPFLIALLNENHKKKGKELAKNIFSDVKVFRKEIEKENFTEKTKAILDDYVQKCYDTIDNLKNTKLRLSLYGVLGKIFKPISIDE